MIVFPNAKINLGLSILNKRADGYHNLETVMYPINLTDIITLNLSCPSNEEKVTFCTTGLKIDGNPDENLIIKAYNLLNTDFHLPSLSVHLHKTIPFGAGLGGGSADGAFTLSGLIRLLKLNISDKKLENYAAQLGSDCPMFIKNKPVLAEGRGELLSPLIIDLSAYCIAVIIPPVTISTKEAYSMVKPSIPSVRVIEIIKEPIETWKSVLLNDFETSVFKQKPEIKTIKEKLYEVGAIYASLSGSGSATFGIFKSKPDLKNIFPKNYFIWLSK
ncbi:MAG: 4-(cytidine 5'-diphospho)-2-C-methyl-D-erythritol kinase [Salinivirgaceae bacterium]